MVNQVTHSKYYKKPKLTSLDDNWCPSELQMSLFHRYQNEKISEDDQLKINPNQNTNHVQLSIKEEVQRLMWWLDGIVPNLAQYQLYLLHIIIF